MQIKLIFRILGVLLMVFSMSMLPPILVSEWYQQVSIKPYFISFLITLLTGFILWLPTRNVIAELKIRDGFVIVVLIWGVLSLFGALPFYISPQPNIHFTDAMFEATSGLTTTGASILSNIDFLPRSLLYYRQQLHFLGGMGIIVLAVAILPMLGVGGMQLYRAETPGPLKSSKLTPRITETAKTLWLVYIGLNIACILCYRLAGMPLFYAIGESFSTVATGGFSMHDASFAYYHSNTIELIAIVFMILGGTNFSLHFLAFKNHNIISYWKDSEFKTFIFILLIVCAISTITIFYYHTLPTSYSSLVEVCFDVVSIITTTGFVTANFSQWPTFVPFLIMIMAIIGGCAGSTSGGIKVMRALLVVKQGLVEIRRLIHPRSVLQVKMGKQILAPEIIQAIWGFLAIFIMIFILILLVLISQGADFKTAFGATVACLANTGATIGNFATSFENMDMLSKWILIIAMIAGRLEIFTLLVLFTPEFWKK